jgi:CSLREA domain-containing protein
MATIEIRSRTLFSIIQLCVVAMMVFATLGLPLTAEAAIYVVNTEDDEDDGECDSTHCSLREAINAANENPGEDQINFDIPGTGDHMIELTSSLPAITDDRTKIDATTQPDYAGEPLIMLDGRVAEVEVGLRVESQRNVIRGIFFSHFGDAEFHGGYTEIIGGAIVLEGDYNRIENNQIAFNTGHGIDIGSDYNIITGNVIGLDEDGLIAWENQGHGIHIRNGSDFNTIGGAGPGEGNIISGNQKCGINIHISEGNSILGNIIGSNERGEVAIPNGQSGIYMQGSGEIGGLNPGEGNMILGNTRSGIVLWDTAFNVVIAGNTIHDNDEYGISVDLYSSAADYNDSFTRNSIYNNGDLGIGSPDMTAEDHFLRIDRATTSEVSGIACRGCLVEVFLAEPDPTGYGEGKTYLGEDRAGVAGEWSVAVSDVEVCDSITATATKSGEGTSEFAENALASCVAFPVSSVFIAFATTWIIFVILGEFLGNEAPPWFTQRPLWRPFVSLLFTAGILLILMLIPNVQFDFSGGNVPPREPVPDCTDFIDPQSISPLDGNIFDLQDDPLLAWQPSGELPKGEIRWRVDLRIPDQSLFSQTTEASELAFSTFGLDPHPVGRYGWYLNGDIKSEAEGVFEPFCEDNTAHFFEFANPPIEEQAQAEEPEVEEQEAETEVEACMPSVTATMNATCRFGPNKVFQDLGYLLEGESAPALAQTQGAGWYQIFLHDKVECWVWSGAVTAECGDDLQILEGPPVPTATPTSKPVDEESPPAPSTLSPKNGETLGCAASIPLKWSAVDDPSGIAMYTIQVERGPQWVPAPGSPFTTTNTAMNFVVNCGVFYRWRVRAEDGAGNIGPWSAWTAFDVILP